MTITFQRKVNKGKLIFRLICLILVANIVFNYSSILKTIFPIPYQHTIFFYAEQNGLDPFLLTAIVKTESNFQAEAISNKGARGLMQIMPDTGMWIIQQTGGHSIETEQLFEPETSIRLGSWYVADLTKEFLGNNIMVLAAYNGGRGNVNEWSAKYGFNGSVDEIDKIPYPETRMFVQKVLLYQKVYRFLYEKEYIMGSYSNISKFPLFLQ
jgi:soluble lytic murein transglycosylase